MPEKVDQVEKPASISGAINEVEKVGMREPELGEAEAMAAHREESSDAEEGDPDPVSKAWINPGQWWAYLTFEETIARRAAPQAVVDRNQMGAYTSGWVAESVLPKRGIRRAPVVEERGFPYWAYLGRAACPREWRFGMG